MKFDKDYRDDVVSVIKNIPNIANLQKKMILITGASGLIGSAVADILCVLNDEFALDLKILLAGRSKQKIEHRFSWMNHKEYEYRKFDIFKDVLNENIDYIVHCAGICNPRLYVEKPVDTLLGIVEGTKSILQTAKLRCVQRTIIISSSEIYGIRPSHDSFGEEDYCYVDLLNSRSCYASGKRVAETLCASYASQYGLDTVIMRPGHIYGAPILDSDDRAPAQFVRCVANKHNIEMKSAGDQLRSYCYSLDCASAVITALINGKAGEAYNVSNPYSIVTIREFAECISNLSNTELEFSNPSDIEQKRFNPMMNSSLDSKKLESLGWIPQFSLKEGVERMLKYAFWTVH